MFAYLRAYSFLVYFLISLGILLAYVEKNTQTLMIWQADRN